MAATAEAYVIWPEPQHVTSGNKLSVDVLAKLITGDARRQARHFVGPNDKDINGLLDSCYLNSSDPEQFDYLQCMLTRYVKAENSCLAVAIKQNGRPVGVLGAHIGNVTDSVTNKILLLATAAPNICAPEVVASQLVASYLGDRACAGVATETDPTFIESPTGKALLEHGFTATLFKAFSALPGFDKMAVLLKEQSSTA